MKQLKILLCCQFPLDAGLGGPKGYLEVAYAYKLQGHDVKLVGINEIVGEDKPYLDELWRIHHFPPYLKEYLLRNANDFDVVEYEAIYAPFSLKPQVKSILVARSVLLELHLRKIKLPIFKGLKPWLSHLFKSWHRNYQLNQRINQSLLGMKYADVVSVSNPSDKEILIENGISRDKIVMQPYGITKSRLAQFDSSKKEMKSSDPFIIAFVGSFDKRKGAVEFPSIIRSIVTKHPEVKFRLMGVLGMFRSKESILEFIGSDLIPHVEIIEKYKPEDLPRLLSECSLGLFPSHLESFGFGVLEMMAMSLPVVGYNSPGISMLIPKSLQVNRGNYIELIQLLIKLIEDSPLRMNLSKECRQSVNQFVYETQENFALKKYLELVNQSN